MQQTSIARLLKPDAVGEILGVSPLTLERWRWAGTGPEYVKVSGRAIRYPEDRLKKFIDDRLRRSTADPGPGAG